MSDRASVYSEIVAARRSLRAFQSRPADTATLEAVFRVAPARTE